MHDKVPSVHKESVWWLRRLDQGKTDTTKINLRSFLSLDLHGYTFMKQKSVSHNLGRSCLLPHCFVMAVSFVFNNHVLKTQYQEGPVSDSCEETKMKIHRFCSPRA